MIELEKSVAELRVSWFGRVVYHCLLKKSMLMKNIDLVFKQSLSKNEKKHFAMAVCSHTVTSIKELILIPFIRKKKLQQRVEIRGIEHLHTASAKNKGVALLSGHFGNWDFTLLIGLPTLQDFNGRFHLIRKSLRIKVLEKIIFGRYQKAGINIINANNGLKEAKKVLRANDIVLFAMDRRVSKLPRLGLSTDFLGNKATTHKSLASLVERKRIAVVPCASYCLSNKKHVLEFYPELEWQQCVERADALLENTLIYNQTLEKILLRNPAQWIWFYNRWQLQSKVGLQTAL